VSNIIGARSLFGRFAWTALSTICCATFALAVAPAGRAQSAPYQRTFSQSKAIVDKSLKEIQSSSSGRLPVLEGFIVPSDRPLARFHRGYYQCDVHVTSTPSGASIVQVNATITAWYTDPVSTKSGYQVLPSNGRLEGDFLDHLQEELGGQNTSSPTTVANSQPTPAKSQSVPTISAPLPGDKTRAVQPKTSGSPFNLSDPLNPANMPSLATQKAMLDRHSEEETKEAKGLEEILHNQARPNNLVAVKKKDTPVLASPREDSKVLFLAAAEDEFEILDANPNWVHIRISGLSRGWVRRSSLELLSDTQPREGQAQSTEPAPVNTQPFQVENEQISSFPGTWAPLHGKTVRIVSLQKTNENATTASPAAKLAFAKSIFEQEYLDLANASTSIVGVVMIFDSEDGGMVAATLPVLREWKAGSLSDEAFWRRCFFDPREAFGLSATQ
jgi:hypothetical protein